MVNLTVDGRPKKEGGLRRGQFFYMTANTPAPNFNISIANPNGKIKVVTIFNNEDVVVFRTMNIEARIEDWKTALTKIIYARQNNQSDPSHPSDNTDYDRLTKLIGKGVMAAVALRDALGCLISELKEVS